MHLTEKLSLSAPSGQYNFCFLYMEKPQPTRPSLLSITRGNADEETISVRLK
jgi:hypothetical protein